VPPELFTKLFADGADLKEILRLADEPYIAGFTTNPSLMWKAGLTDYRAFADKILDRVPDRAISFEVVADDPADISRQARLIAEWGDNVFAKVPITTTEGESLAPVIRELAEDGIRLNVTAILTLEQVEVAARALGDGPPGFVSVFAGRIADTGVDPVPLMREAVAILSVESPVAELIWASPREVLNVVQADSVGCHVITLTKPLIDKLECLGKDLERYSLETVRMFHRDAATAGLTL
jgi:transaldolase